MHPNATGKRTLSRSASSAELMQASQQEVGLTHMGIGRDTSHSPSHPYHPSSLQGLAGQERVGSRSPPPAALPLFTAVAPGPIPAELHRFGALGLLTALAWFQSGPSTNFSILLVMESRRERNGSFPVPLVMERHALLCQCIRSFTVIKPNKSFADGSRSCCPETLPASLPLQSPFLQSRKHWTVPETSSPTWCPTGRASWAWTLQLWVLVPGTAAAAAVP